MNVYKSYLSGPGDGRDGVSGGWTLQCHLCSLLHNDVPIGRLWSDPWRHWKRCNNSFKNLFHNWLGFCTQQTHAISANSNTLTEIGSFLFFSCDNKPKTCYSYIRSGARRSDLLVVYIWLAFCPDSYRDLSTVTLSQFFFIPDILSNTKVPILIWSIRREKTAGGVTIANANFHQPMELVQQKKRTLLFLTTMWH